MHSDYRSIVQRSLGSYFHALIAWPIYLFWTLVLGFFIGVGALNPSDKLRRFGLKSLSWIWGGAMWRTQPFWSRKTLGLENLSEGPFVIVANHQSVLDIPRLFSLPIPLTVSARPGIFHVKVMGQFLSLSGQINTDNLLTHAKAALEEGISVVVFAEGTRSPDGEVHRFRQGAFHLAKETNTPILPVALDGAGHILGKRGYIPTQTFVTTYLSVLPPVLPDGPPSELAKQVRAQISTEVHRLREAPAQG